MVMHPSNRLKNILVAGFFLLLTLLGLLTVMDYGRPWDETTEIGILRMSLMEYTQYVNWETPYQQALEKMGVRMISRSVERDHGVCMYYPLFWAVCNTDLSDGQVTFLFRCMTWLIFMLGALSLYFLCRRMGLSHAFACIGVLLLILTPRFFADAHYNNKDLPLMCLTLCLMWQALRLVEKPSFVRGLLFALVAAACMNTRVIGFALVGFCGLMIVIRLWVTQKLTWHVVIVGVETVVLCAAFYLLLTPASLKHPLQFLRYLMENAVGFSRWHNTVLYMGTLIHTSTEKLPFHYLPVMIFLTTPLWALLLLLLGQVKVFWEAITHRFQLFLREDGFLALLATGLWLLPLASGMVMRVLVYNGWRHFYFLYAPMVVLMVYGLKSLWGAVQNRKTLRALSTGALAVSLGVSAVTMTVNHPYEYGYYQPLLSRQNANERFEVDYWNVSCVNALEALLKLEPGTSVIRIAASDPDSGSGLDMAIGLMNTARFEVVPLDSTATPPAYILSNPTYARINGYTPPNNLKPIVVIQAYGIPMMMVYAGSENASPSSAISS